MKINIVINEISHDERIRRTQEFLQTLSGTVVVSNLPVTGIMICLSNKETNKVATLDCDPLGMVTVCLYDGEEHIATKYLGSTIEAPERGLSIAMNHVSAGANHEPTRTH